MLTNIASAEYISDSSDIEYGAVRVITHTASIPGYKNSMLIYQAANTLSVPDTNVIADIDYQNPSQMQIIGFNNRIKDINYSIQANEWTGFSTNWYLSTRVNGIEIQQAQTSNKENMMMGQSTNKVLEDIMSLLVDLVTYISTHTHSGVQTGGGNSGIPIQPVPDDSTVVNDQTYISGNKNLAATGYEPK